MWKVLEAFLGNSRAQPRHQLVAVALGPLCTKPSPVQFCAAALLNVSARESQPGPPKRQHRAQAIGTKTQSCCIQTNPGRHQPGEPGQEMVFRHPASSWLLSSQESEWLHTPPATASRELCAPLLHSGKASKINTSDAGLSLNGPVARNKNVLGTDL